MTRANATILLVLAFASGFASGIVVTGSRPSRSALDQATRRERLTAIEDEVGLDPDQRKRFEEISDKNHERFLAVTRSVAPDLAAIRSDVRSQMRTLMTDEQRRRFDAVLARIDDARKKADE